MALFESFRAKLQAAFLGLGLTAIGLTGWEASSGATEALREATYDRLTAIRETRRRQIERYFQDLGNHVLALSGDESTVSAVEEFAAAWQSMPPIKPGGIEERKLREHYQALPGADSWFPKDLRVASLQHMFLSLPAGRYGRIHERHHPTLSRYKSAFGFYDVFLIDTATSRVLYTVLKEVDFGVDLDEPPYRESALARVYRLAMDIREPDRFALRDYERYLPSRMTPAAFVAAPIWRNGNRIGVLAIQISTDEVNRVMTSDGEAARAYILGAGGRPGAGRVLRSDARVNVPGLDWTVVAEIDEAQAFAPARALRNRVLGLGALIAVAFLVGAALLARTVTRPVLELAAGTRRLAGGDFTARLPVSSRDEIGQLAESFNRMTEDLARTTVSKEELEKLAGKLISAQEDERRRIARELHDDLTQRLAAVAIEAGGLEKLPDSESLGWRERVRRIKEQIAGISHDVASLSRSLHPAMLEELGLLAAIQAECRAAFERGGPPVEFHGPESVEGLSRQAQLGLYRIVQEALNNIRKHAHAEIVTVRLRLDPDEAHLEIVDDGQGFDRSVPGWRPGIGLASMEERARLLGGRFALRSRPSAGTKIEVRLPRG